MPSDSESDSDIEHDAKGATSTQVECNTLDIQQAIECLYRVSIGLQRQKTTNRYEKCSDIDTSFFEPFDIEYVKQKCPAAEDFLLQRLGKAISRRRRWLKYRELHAVKLAQFLNQPEDNIPSSASIYSETTATTFEIPVATTEDQSITEDDLQSDHSDGMGLPPSFANPSGRFNLDSLRRVPSVSTIATETTYAVCIFGASFPSLKHVAGVVCPSNNSSGQVFD